MEILITSIDCEGTRKGFDYELATIIKCGIDDMYVKNNDNFYYLTLMNENYLHPSRPKTATDQAILNGAYLFKKTTKSNLRLLASGVTLRFAERAAEILQDFEINCDLWSITSFNELAREGLSSERKKLNGEKSDRE